jgi:hypothetical protein
MKVILSVHDEGYFERTRWRLFWAYLMKVIPETRRAHKILYLRCYSQILTKFKNLLKIKEKKKMKKCFLLENRKRS